MPIFVNDAFDQHEQVVFGYDPATGLRAIIAIHSTARGPALGGGRMWPYADEAEALRDVLRLSRSMSYKNALADLPLGGGKAVIIGDARSLKTPELLRAFGRLVDRLGGNYITAEDMNMSPADMQEVAATTRHVVGLEKGRSASGDPSPVTARGVWRGIEATARQVLGRADLAGVHIAVQGLGHVGAALCDLLHAAGARLTVTDINPQSVAAVVAATGAASVPPDAIFDVPADIFSPCAMGAVLNERSVPRLAVRAVAGAANNQLAHDGIGELLLARGILYAPDYVINAGGVINVTGELLGHYDRAATMAKVDQIGPTLLSLYARAAAEARPTNVIADQIARERIAHATAPAPRQGLAAR